LARERDRLRAELENINKERAALERERSDIERLRREALEEVGRIPGLGIVDSDSLINITLTDQALRFDEGSAQIPFPEGYRVLARIGEFLANYPGKMLRIEAHTDNVPLSEEFRETYKDNQALSAARAETVRNYFVEVERISPNLITANGLGSKEPVADNETEQGRALNRRIVILIRK
jgi:chemotaxis protein MotB